MQLIDAKTVSIMLLYPLKISIMEVNTQVLLDHNNDAGTFTDNRGNYIVFLSVRQNEGQNW